MKRLASLFIILLLVGSMFGTVHAQASGVKVLAYNVMFLSQAGKDGYDANKRAQLLAQSPLMKGQDVIILTELFMTDAAGKLLDALKADYPYQTPIVGQTKQGWDRTAGSYASWTTVNGGVAVLSKYPLEKKVQYIYKNAIAEEFFANKGFAYVTFTKGGERFHVIGTHMQANAEFDLSGNKYNSIQSRAKQLQEMRTFIDGENIAKTETVLVAGDLNINRLAETTSPVDYVRDEYRQLLKTLNAYEPHYKGTTTFDPVNNTMAADRYPGTAQEWLDFILPLQDYKVPAGWTNEVVSGKTAPYTISGKPFTDLSDHEPLQGYTP